MVNSYKKIVLLWGQIKHSLLYSKFIISQFIFPVVSSSQDINVSSEKERNEYIAAHSHHSDSSENNLATSEGTQLHHTDILAGKLNSCSYI